MAKDDAQRVVVRPVRSPEEEADLKKEEAALKKAEWEREFALIFYVGVPILLIILLDVALYGFYETWDYYRTGGESRMVELRQTLRREEGILRGLEDKLKQIDLEQTGEHASKDPGEALSRRAEYTACYDSYAEEHGRYEENVERYNSLVKKRISRWYLIPIPVRTGR